MGGFDPAHRSLLRTGTGRPRSGSARCLGRAWILAVALAIAAAQLAFTSVALAAEAPQIDATWVSGVTASSADLHAEIDPEGAGTTYRFEYIGEAAYEANLGAGREAFSGAVAVPATPGSAGSGTSPQKVLQHIPNPPGLAADTPYRYRVEAMSHCNPGAPAEVCTSVGPTRSLRTEENAPVFVLPDHRGWELVSPADKNGGQIQGPGGNFGGDVIQAAASGAAITYSSSTSFAGGSGAPPASQYVSRRGEAGWATENVSGPTLSGSYGPEPDGVPFQLFSPDLERGVLLDGRRCAEGEACPRSYSLWEGGAPALSSPTAPDLALAGASPDLRQIVLSSCAALATGASEVLAAGGGCEQAATNLYRWSASGLDLINFLPGQASGTPGARLAASSGAVSADGSRIYFSDGGDLYLREGSATKWVDEAQGGGGSFQLASSDGATAFYTEAETLYCYLAATDTSEAIASGVKGVLGGSEDGSWIYFQTGSGLFAWHTGSLLEVAAGAAAAAPADWPPATGTARVSPDGTHLAFLSGAELTGYESLGESEVYVYDAAGGGSLLCASCDPSGERPLGAATIPGAVANGTGPGATDSYKPRALVADGDRVFFDTPDPLVLQDTDGATDVYEWEAPGTNGCGRAAGCVGLISGGREGSASFLDASAAGSDAFFLTSMSLVPGDLGSADVYDAREGGGFPATVEPLPCDGDACQPIPVAPEDPTPGTLGRGQGNPPLRVEKEHRAGRRHHRRKHRRKKAHHHTHRGSSGRHPEGGRRRAGGR